MSKKKTKTKKTSTPASPQSQPDTPETADVPVAVHEAPTLIDVNLPAEPAPTPAAVAVAEPPLPIAPAPTPAEIAAMPLKEAPPPPPPPPPPPTTMRDAIDLTVEPLAPVEPELGDHDVHPDIKIPMALIRDKKRMVRYAQAIGRDLVEAQSRREKLKLTPQVMYLYRHYKKYCEQHGMHYWTERGFAPTLVCFYRGVPLEEPEQEPEQDILGRISEGVSREQSRK